MTDPPVLELPPEWAPILRGYPESGMGYTICTVRLQDGRQYQRVVISGGFIVRCDGSLEIPFSANEIVEIIPTHDRRTAG